VTYRAVAGHKRIKTLLSRTVQRGTVPPTLLFAGPHGIGKQLVAQATAAALNCLAPVADAGGCPVDACGTCRACDRIARGMHVDVLQLEPDDMAAIKIDAVRDVLERTGFRPFEGRRRVVIIDHADALVDAAQNALLKSLEEPPPSTIFILTTAVPGALLPTVRSRCMRLRFGRLTETEVAEVLARDHGFAAREARAAAALADGSIGQALALTHADLAVIRETALQVLQHTARNPAVASKLQSAATIIGPLKKERTREDVGLVLRVLASMIRDIELLNTGADVRVLANPAMSDELGALTRSFGGERAREAFGVVERAMAAIERNAGPKVVAEWVATQI
jgi:DNA polymerase-3 subunit delta'